MRRAANCKSGKQSAAEAAYARSAIELGKRKESPPRVRGSCINSVDIFSKSGYWSTLTLEEGGSATKGGSTDRIRINAISVAAVLNFTQAEGNNVRKV